MRRTVPEPLEPVPLPVTHARDRSPVLGHPGGAGGVGRSACQPPDASPLQSWGPPPWQTPTPTAYFSSSCDDCHTVKERCMRSFSVSLTLVKLVVGMNL